MITPEQLRMARAKLNYSQGYVAEKLGIAHTTLSKIEKGESDSPLSRINDIREFYENEGLEFIEDNGVREAKAYVRRYNGTEGFRAFSDDVYQTVSKTGGELCLYNAIPQNWIKFLGKEWYATHNKRMTDLGHKIRVKITACEGETGFISTDFAEYRWFPKELFNKRAFYAYGDKLGFLNFEEEDVQILVLQQEEFTKGFRVLFNIAWDHVAILPPSKDNNINNGET